MTAYEQQLIDAGRGHLIGPGEYAERAQVVIPETTIGDGPRTFRLDGWNGLRRIRFAMVVRAENEIQATRLADEWRRDNNKVRAESWRTKEVTPEPPLCGV